MTIAHKVWAAVAGLTVMSALLSGCGSHSPAVATTSMPSPASLTGNWLLAGALAPGQQSGVSVALVVSGSQITGHGFAQYECSPQSTVGKLVILSGQLAPDGSFQLAEPFAPVAPGLEQITLSGNLPTAASPTSWNGSYTFTGMAGGVGPTTCNFNQTSAFTASPISAVTGTYAGQANNPNSAQGIPGTSVAFAINVTQNSPDISGAIRLAEALPLTATITVTGSPCFTSGTTQAISSSGTSLSPVSPSYVGGSSYALAFLMNDGSTLSMDGFLEDVAASRLSAAYFVVGGSCKGSTGFTTLTRS